MECPMRSSVLCAAVVEFGIVEYAVVVVAGVGVGVADPGAVVCVSILVEVVVEILDETFADSHSMVSTVFLHPNWPVLFGDCSLNFELPLHVSGLLLLLLLKCVLAFELAVFRTYSIQLH